jgi:hypothetical protein
LLLDPQAPLYYTTLKQKEVLISNPFRGKDIPVKPNFKWCLVIHELGIIFALFLIGKMKKYMIR